MTTTDMLTTLPLTLATSSDYGAFKMLEFNRELHRGTIERIKLCMAEVGFLPIHPIIVTKDYEIIDGQHRFVAARELGIPFYYMITDGATDTAKAMIVSNTNKRSWTPDDYTNYYAKLNNPYYIGLQDFAKRHDVRTGVAMSFISGHSVNYNKSVTKMFRDGLWCYTMDEMHKAEICFAGVTRITEIANLPFKGSIYKALIKMSATKGFDWDKMIDKVTKYRDLIYVPATTAGGIAMFAKVYNFHETKGRMNFKED